MIKDRVNSYKPSGDIPQGVSFDGSTDYLSRSSDLVGNVDSKTFTFSIFGYFSKTHSGTFYSNGSNTSTTPFLIEIDGSGSISLLGKTASTAHIFGARTGGNFIKANTFFHLLISVDLSNTSNRHIFLNDVDITSSFGSWVYVNNTIDFTTAQHLIGGYSSSISRWKGRLSHLFLDYTYRDLSIEANRRLFITAEGKPADGLASLNPILYLPMTDASTAHINKGTGGDFVQNGILATADRGPNQDNCVASKFNGTSQYLSRTSLTGIADGKQFTFRCTFSLSSSQTLHFYGQSVSTVIKSEIVYTNTGILRVRMWDSVGNNIFHAENTASLLKIGVVYDMAISVDLSDINTRHFTINNKPVPMTYSSYIDANIDFTTNIIRIGAFAGTISGYFDGNLGELYFDTSYIDLATNNPFWDSKTNKPIPVKKVMANLGSNPLICMPIDASNPTKNYGSGGDFTLSGGGLVGARGASEFIARSVKFGTTSSYLQKLSPALIGNSSKFTYIHSFYVGPNVVSTSYLSRHEYNTLGTYMISTSLSTTESISIVMYGNNAGVATANFRLTGTGLTINSWNTIVISFDLVDTRKKHAFLNNTDISLNVDIFQNYPLQLDDISELCIGASSISNGMVEPQSFVYTAFDYIDFSQESNRNLFVNQLGYVRSLDEPIAQGLIPEPLIYLKFDDPSNLGKNSGSGSDFQINGSVTQGSDFSVS